MHHSAERSSESGVSIRNYIKSDSVTADRNADAADLESNGMIIIPQVQICPYLGHICPYCQHEGATQLVCVRRSLDSGRVNSTTGTDTSNYATMEQRYYHLPERPMIMGRSMQLWASGISKLASQANDLGVPHYTYM